MKVSRIVATSAFFLALVPLAACSSPASTTCSAYAAKTYTQQTVLVLDLIESHGLDPNSNVYGTALVAADIDKFCGIRLGTQSATKNANASIDNGVNWKLYKA